MGPFDIRDDLRRIEDWDWLLRLFGELCRAGKTLPVVPEYLTHYSGLHPAAANVELLRLDSFQRKYEKFFPPSSKESITLKAAIAWKKVHVELSLLPMPVVIFKMGANPPVLPH